MRTLNDCLESDPQATLRRERPARERGQRQEEKQGKWLDKPSQNKQASIAHKRTQSRIQELNSPGRAVEVGMLLWVSLKFVRCLDSEIKWQQGLSW